MSKRLGLSSVLYLKRLLILLLAVLVIIPAPYLNSLSTNTGSMPVVLGTINVKTQVYEGPVLLIGPPGVKMVQIIKDDNISKSLSLPLTKEIFLERPPITSFQLTVEAQGPTMDDVIVSIGAQDVNYSGENVVVGIIDTGIDFLSKGLGPDKIAFDEKGFPMLFDADEFGLVITPLNVTYRNPYTKMLATEGNYVEIFIPTYGKARVYVDFDWAAPQIESKSGYYKFGFMVAFMFPGNYLLGGSLPAIGYLVPSVMVDSQQEGLYDTVFLDLSTTWFTLGGIFYAFGAILEPPPLEMLDFSFRDETPLRMGEGVAGLDFDGDGVFDYSLGVVSGYVYDAYGIINEEAELGGMTWETAWEPLATGVYPGLDPGGRYFSLFYDPLGHGTSVANIIAGKQAKYFIPTQQGLTVIESRGIAPDAKIAGAMALFSGNVLAALYWLSGHDYSNGTWIYTANHKADVISNSWGVLYWPATLLADGPGFPPGSDPLSLHLRNITEKTVVVFAAGNEGPGKASIAMGGASEDVITVGASTVFGRAIYDAFGHLLIPEGVANGIISWSSRGPNGVLVPKPDIVAPGAYALVPTAVINGLGDGTQAIDIFGGTSMATPVVSGALALLIDKLKQESRPPLSTKEAKSMLIASSVDLGYPSDMQGSGLLNVTRLLEAPDRPEYSYIARVGDVFIDGSNGTLIIELNEALQQLPDNVSLVIDGRPVVLFRETVNLRQYEQTFVDIPLNGFEDEGYYKITVRTTRNVTSEPLPFTIVWLGGWNESKTNVESPVEKIVLIDHALLSGKQVTLFASTNVINKLANKGLLFNGTSLRLMLFSSIDLTENIMVEAWFVPLETYTGTLEGGRVVFTDIGSIDTITGQATLILDGMRIPIPLYKTLTLGNDKVYLEIKVQYSTHSAYLTSLGDLYITPIRKANEPGQDGHVVGYVFTVVTGRADLYLIGDEFVGNSTKLSVMKSYYATHPPGYIVVREAYYPYPKQNPGKLIVPADAIKGDARLLIYVLDAKNDTVRIKITPIIAMKTNNAGKTFIAIISEEPLGPLRVEPSMDMIYHEGGVKLYRTYSAEGVNKLVLVGGSSKQFESYLSELGLLTKSLRPNEAIVLNLAKIQSRYTPA